MTTSEFASAEVKLTGTTNSVTGLTSTSSGHSIFSFTMPANGFADTGRIITTGLAVVASITIPE